MNTSPNVVLIQADQWRGDCLSGTGHPVVHTPYLDRLASQGVRFDRAYSATPVCIPARAALLTGQSARCHGFVGYEETKPWNFDTTLAGEFTHHGYQTQAIGKMHVYPERAQLGFQNVILHDGYSVERRRRDRDQTQVDDYLYWLRRELGDSTADDFAHGVHCNSNNARPWPLEERLHPTNWVASEGVDFLRRRDTEKPFFLYLSFHRPHPPYDPPAWAFEHFLSMEMPDPPIGDWADSLADFEAAVPDTSRNHLRPDLLQRARAGYYGHLLHIDNQINRFLYSLDEYGIYDDTVICFTSDHGELLGDHHLFRKSLPYEGSSRVPLILKGQVDSRVTPGSRSKAVVEQRDIMPTLLEAAGLPIPAEIDGRSFLAQAKGDPTPVRPWLHGELTTHGQSVQWLTDENEKYVWFSSDGREQLFDLASDPQELKDLARSPTSETQAKLATWRNRLVDELTDREEGFVNDSHELVHGRPARLVLTQKPAAVAATGNQD